MSPAYSWVNCLLNRLDGPGCFLVLATSSDVCDLFQVPFLQVLREGFQ